MGSVLFDITSIRAKFILAEPDPEIEKAGFKSGRYVVKTNTYVFLEVNLALIKNCPEPAPSSSVWSKLSWDLEGLKLFK